MATIRAVNCSRCGKKILNGLNYTHNGKSLCYDCYEIAQRELLATEENKQKLYQYIKKLFSLKELSNNVVITIDKEILKGRKYEEIQSTLHYYYEVMSNPCGSPEVIPFILRDNYDNARDYEKEVARVKEINSKFDLTKKIIRTVVIHRDDLISTNNIHKKIPYNMEDL